MENLNGKRLLLVGGVNPTADLVSLAHKHGVFLGVADYNKDTRLKRLADAAYEVNALDVEGLVKLCREEHYDGVISNFVDLVSPYVTRVSEELGMHVPYTVEQLRLSTDKQYFKDKCLEYGVSVPKGYSIKTREDILTQEIDYPVIIKPVDGSGSKGITACHNQQELLKGFETAMRMSRSGEIIVEAYLPYDEINVTYIAQDGDIRLAAIHDRYFNTSQADAMKVPDMYIYPSRYTNVYLEKFNEPVIHMLKEMGIKNGSLFMQAVVKDNVVYFYEAGMRLNGCKTYQILEVENGFNTFERLMHLALTGSMGEHVELTPRFNKWYATWNVIGRPGAVIGKHIGLEELRAQPWLVHAAVTYVEGEKIPDTAKGTLIQLVGRIHISGETREDLIANIRKMYEIYHVVDPAGENVLLQPHDPEDLLAQLNYTL